MAQIYKIYMNQSLLILADYTPHIKEKAQTIGLQDIDLEKLFNDSAHTTDKTVYLYIHPNIRKVFKKYYQQQRLLKQQVDW
jgi:hypothetical protein